MRVGTVVAAAVSTGSIGAPGRATPSSAPCALRPDRHEVDLRVVGAACVHVARLARLVADPLLTSVTTQTKE